MKMKIRGFFLSKVFFLFGLVLYFGIIPLWPQGRAEEFENEWTYYETRLREGAGVEERMLSLRRMMKTYGGQGINLKHVKKEMKKLQKRMDILDFQKAWTQYQSQKSKMSLLKRLGTIDALQKRFGKKKINLGPLKKEKKQLKKRQVQIEYKKSWSFYQSQVSQGAGVQERVNILDRIKQKFGKKGIDISLVKKERSGLKVLLLDSFEDEKTEWAIPSWAFVKSDNAGISLDVDRSTASQGQNSLKVKTRFKSKMWSGAYVEIEMTEGYYLNFRGYQTLSADIFIPSEAPDNLKGEFILTVGYTWAWTEMKEPIILPTGKWTTLSVDLTTEGNAWLVPLTEKLLGDVRKVGIRVQSNQDSYQGPVYIDNIRLEFAKDAQ